MKILFLIVTAPVWIPLKLIWWIFKAVFRVIGALLGGMCSGLQGPGSNTSSYSLMTQPDSKQRAASAFDPKTYIVEFALKGRGRMKTTIAACSEWEAKDLIRAQYPGVSGVEVRRVRD